MTYTAYPNGISSMGVPIPGFTSGQVFFVDLADGSDSNSGKDTEHPFLTIETALAACADDNDDVIYVSGQGAINNTTIDKNGVSIIGIPSYDSPMGGRCRIAVEEQSGGAASWGLVLAADKVRIENIRFTVEDEGSAISTNATSAIFQCVIRNCQITLTTANGRGIYIRNTGTLSRSLIENVSIRGEDGIDGIAGIVTNDGVSSGNLIRNCYFENLATAIDLDTSQNDVVEYCTAMNCTASFEVTGATSLLNHYTCDVAPSSTALEANGATAV